MAGGNANVSYNPPYQVPVAGAVTRSGGGGGLLLTGARDILDARRLMETGHVPSAAYPDGYLGTIGAGSRREDRLLNSVANRATQRSYQRGVHKGERIDPADYYWTPEVNPAAALIAQAEGRKWTQKGSMIGAPLVNDGKSQTLVATQARFADAQRVYTQESTPPFTGYNEQRRAQLMRFKPSWT
ncbi:hypothetical protein [Saccharothrix sp. ST-888]|uniref:hypothetical protein n=1 Tax=Saccharothrix sp. ST-888 TaxID=1427391 RepID=UPI0005EBF5A9|nr:hypothetical protein [Saccharothrix sp. ST-888]KJK56227.1 hypothetical protein UK12_23885 [Saccharothrix sp. ST-888]